MKKTEMFVRTCALIGIVGIAPAALADTVVIPNTDEFVDGPSNNAFPFNGGSPMRVQQIFRADQLGGLSGAVTQIAFRVDESSGDPFTSGPIDVEVRLSHTSVDPLSMSLTFDDNFGSGTTLVLDDSITLSSGGPGSGFDIIIDIDDTFIYDGTSNLLVEYKVFNNAFTTQFDAAGTGLGSGGLDTINRVWAFGADAASGSSNGDDGYVTQLTIGGGFSIAYNGPCPGASSVDVSGATPGGRVGLLFSPSEGAFVIPSGQPCAGTMLGLSGAGLQLLNTATADANGDVTFNGNAPAGACGGKLQAVDAGTCDTSNVETIS